MNDDIQIPLIFTDAAAKKVKSLIEGEDNPNSTLIADNKSSAYHTPAKAVLTCHA